MSDGAADSSAPIPEAIAISAMATEKPTVGNIVRGRRDAIEDQRPHKIAVFAFFREVNRWRSALFPPADFPQIHRLPEPACRFSDQQYGLVGSLESKRGGFSEIINQADATD